jgi:glutamate-ammonia-ligase adenylyltransferase
MSVEPEVAAALASALPEVRSSAAAVLAASDFVGSMLAAEPASAGQLLASGLSTALELAAPVPTESEADFMARLRRWRRTEFLRIAWRDLAGWATLVQTLHDLSAAADVALRAAREFAWRTLTARHGVPRDFQGEPQSLITVAMGKLGGGELNFSSDIDLVFLYPESGHTDGALPLDNGEFFTRLGQHLIRLLAARTEHGFVFRVDMRLRPFGDSGPLVSNASALEDYLQIHGRDWERYAWIKARAVTGMEAYARLWEGVIRPFVYRRYLDFGVFESLRDMKALIEREVSRRELSDHIKLGDGGIREIEFIVQSFQLIRGGQDRRLQTTSLLRALPLLAGKKLLPASAVQELANAYEFLRRLENRLQMRAEQQTHTLPVDAAERARIAHGMGFQAWDAFAAELARQRAAVSAHFHATVFGGAKDAGSGDEAALAALWEAGPDGAALAGTLGQMGYPKAEAGDAVRLLLDFGESAVLRRLDVVGRQRLTVLMPVLAREAAQAAAGAAAEAAGAARGTIHPLATLRRLLRIVEAVGQRSSYFSLLLHNVRARGRLVELAAHGDFLANQIALHPLLLDELLDERLFDRLPLRAALAEDLAERMAGVDPDDEERQVERLRHFQRAALFRIAIADLFGHAPLMHVSDRLTDVAELILEHALALAWQQLTRTLGTPMCGEGERRRAVRICAVGYGKLGGMELGYSSDLDLVFLHDSSGERAETEGARSIDNQVFFVRFAQRLVHLLTMHSAAGRLYEVDMRLRPSGKGGMLITRIDAFAEYQRHEAWTWEHQALLHARAVAGDPVVRERFEQVRMEVLQYHVRRDSLREEVLRMRTRMRRELSRAGDGQFDLKQDPGGIADIEFLAQFWALRSARDYPPVAWFADTIRQLESVGSAALVPHADVDALTRIYRRYRECIHHRALDGLGDVLPADQFATERAAVTGVWDRVMAAGGSL